jgi:(2R)-3-sulfolactate dehydrogenase (NADP+)
MSRIDVERTFVGGARGANIALMVEVLAAGLAGDNWALDAP